MDDLSAADVEGYMVNASAGGIKEEVAGLKAVKTHGSAAGMARTAVLERPMPKLAKTD